MGKYIEYTAEDEMPNCGCCDHLCDNFNCVKLCGAERGWFGYRRTEKITDDELKMAEIILRKLYEKR